MALVAACSLLLVAGCDDDPSSDSEKELVVVSFGGSFQDAERAAFFEPFADQFNVKVTEKVYTGTYAEVQAALNGVDPEWDVIDVDTPVLLRGADAGLYQVVDQNILPANELASEAIHPNGVAICFWAYVMAYNSDLYPDQGAAPANWQDFWDLDKFPGGRSLRKTPRSTLEFALMADGVDPSKLYPLDLDRAFESLDKIKSEITWWEDAETPVNLLASGDVVMASAFNGRIYNGRQDGKPVLEVWNNGLRDADWWVIAKGSKNADVAESFIAFASQALQQAELPKHIPYGPANEVALGQLSAEVVQNLPTNPQHADKMIFLDSEWWRENQDDVEARWNEWLGKR